MTLDKKMAVLTINVPTKQLTNVKIGLMALVKSHLSLNRISPKTNLTHLIGDTFLLRILCESLPPWVTTAGQLRITVAKAQVQ